MQSFKTCWTPIAAMSLMIFLSACGNILSPTATATSNSSTSTTIVFNGNGTESNVPGCPAIKRLRVDYPNVLSIADGNRDASVTPFDVNGNERSKSCDEGDGIQWTVPAFVQISKAQAFVTDLRGKSTGTGNLKVKVGTADSGDLPIQVVP